MRKSILLLAVLPLMFFSCDDEEKTTVTVSAKSGAIYNGDETEFAADVSGAEIREITFYFNNTSIGSVIGKPYTIRFIPRDIEPGAHKVTAKVKTKSNKEIWAETSVSLSLRLGDEFQGGKIFEINTADGYALISAKSDLVIQGASSITNAFAWGDLGQFGTQYYGGKGNTATMIRSASTSSIYVGSYFKGGYEFNGYNDWYIPSMRELSILKENKLYVGGFSTDTSDAMSTYWSSSEVINNREEAYCVNMNMGEVMTKHRFSQYRVRPIREYIMK